MINVLNDQLFYSVIAALVIGIIFILWEAMR